MTEEARQEVRVPVIWTDTEELQVLLANQFLAQVGQQDEIFLTFGQMTPPPLVGDAKQMEEQLKQIPYVTIKGLAQLGLTRTGLDELINVLQKTVENYDRLQQEKRGGE